MQICGDFSVDLKAKYRLLMKDLRRLVLPYMRLGVPPACPRPEGLPDLSLRPERSLKAHTHRGFCWIKVRRLESPRQGLDQSPASAAIQLKS